MKVKKEEIMNKISMLMEKKFGKEYFAMVRSHHPSGLDWETVLYAYME